MKVVMFQLIIKTPTAMPIMEALKPFTEPRYSGARYNASAPNIFMKLPFNMLNNMPQ
jgi:hypothetical protein